MAEEFDIGPVTFDVNSQSFYVDVKDVGRLWLRFENGKFFLELNGFKTREFHYLQDMGLDSGLDVEIAKGLGLNEDQKIRVSKAILALKINDQVKEKFKPFTHPLSLHNPRLLDEISKIYHKWIVGEDNNIKQLFLICLSKNLPEKDRLHVIVIGESSAGKSYLTRGVLEPFQAYLKEFTRMTQASPDRMEESFDGKILFIEQMVGSQDANPSLKFLMSEGKLILATVERDEKTKKWITKEVKTEGMPVFVSTSTKIDLDQETLNRVFILSLDESEQQTKEIKRFEALQESLPDFMVDFKNDVEKIKALIETLESQGKTEILIPYAEKIVELFPNSLKVRRDFKKALKLTKLVTYLYQFQRPKLILKNGDGSKVGEYILSTVEDFKLAMQISSKSLQQTIHNLTEKAFEILKICKELSDEEIQITKRTIAERYKVLSQKRIGHYLEALISAGFLTKEKAGRENVYFLTDKPIQEFKFEIDFTKEEFETFLNKYFKGFQYEIVEPFSQNFQISRFPNTQNKPKELETSQKSNSNLLSFSISSLEGLSTPSGNMEIWKSEENLVKVLDPSGLPIVKEAKKIRVNPETRKREAYVCLGCYGWKWLPVIENNQVEDSAVLCDFCKRNKAKYWFERDGLTVWVCEECSNKVRSG